MITSWDEYFERRFEAGPDGHTLWKVGADLRPEMSGKFRRICDRVERKIAREFTPYAYAVHDSRQYMRVRARKFHARKRRKR
jgi:hypothetical protein